MIIYPTIMKKKHLFFFFPPRPQRPTCQADGSCNTNAPVLTVTVRAHRFGCLPYKPDESHVLYMSVSPVCLVSTERRRKRKSLMRFARRFKDRGGRGGRQGWEGWGGGGRFVRRRWEPHACQSSAMSDVQSLCICLRVRASSARWRGGGAGGDLAAQRSSNIKKCYF